MKSCKRSAFSMLELVIVLVIIGVIAAIAIPRLPHVASRAAETALARDVNTLNKAVEMYAVEHGGAFPDPARVVRQLLEYTDQAGNPSPQRRPPFVFGPYLRSIPPLPLGIYRGSTGVAEVSGPGIGWIYNRTTGEFSPNLGGGGPSEVEVAAAEVEDPG